MKKWYKTTYFENWWNQTMVDMKPFMHIEEIAEECKKYITGDFWTEITNVQWTIGENQAEIVGTIDQLPSYIKCVANNITYYFYLYDKTINLVDKDGNWQYTGYYIIDEYMTKWNYKLQLLCNHDFNAEFIHKFEPRWHKEGDTYSINLFRDRHLSNYEGENYSLIRENCFNTDKDQIWIDNFSDIQYTDIDIPFVNGTDESHPVWSITASELKSLMETPSNTGRYRYRVAQPSAICSTQNSNFISTNTKQSILVIPLFSGSQTQILHAINDIDITKSQNGAIVPTGNNQIGVHEEDLPFSILYGLYCKDPTNIHIYYAQNETNKSEKIKIIYFEIPCNYYNKIKLLNYTQYNSGLAGILNYMISNTDKLLPTTEPSMYAPQCYQEIYDNGMGKINNDLSYFVFSWTPNTIKNDVASLSLYATIMFDNDLIVGLNYGDMTNTLDPSLDNTNVRINPISIKNNIISSASSKYYTENVNTGLTSVQNRESERRQSWTQFALNTASSVVDIATGSIETAMLSSSPVGQIGSNIKGGLGIISRAIANAEENKRKNRQLKSQVNNIYSAPSSNDGLPFIKGIIPNNNKLFEFKKLHLNPIDEKLKFTKYLHNSYPINKIDSFKSFINREYMNVLHIEPTTTYDEIFRILKIYDNSNFRTPKDFDEFIIWLGGMHHIYRTIFPVNVIDYQASDYVHNVEIDLPPQPKEDINLLITNIPNYIPAYSDDAIQYIKDANPSLVSSSVWDEIEIVKATYTEIYIKAKDDSTHYRGIIQKPRLCYNAYIMVDGIKHYIYDINQVFCNYGQEYLTLESGVKFLISDFNYQIHFNTRSSITEIKFHFLRAYKSYNQQLILPDNLTSIGRYFMKDCESFAQTLTLPNSLTAIYTEQFLSNANNFNSLNIQNLTIDNFIDTEPSHVGYSTILSTTNNTAPMYVNGVEITGTNKEAFLNKYPTLSGPWYRKLK